MGCRGSDNPRPRDARRSHALGRRELASPAPATPKPRPVRNCGTARFWNPAPVRMRPQLCSLLTAVRTLNTRPHATLPSGRAPLPDGSPIDIAVAFIAAQPRGATRILTIHDKLPDGSCRGFSWARFRPSGHARSPSCAVRAQDAIEHGHSADSWTHHRPRQDPSVSLSWMVRIRVAPCGCAAMNATATSIGDSAGKDSRLAGNVACGRVSRVRVAVREAQLGAHWRSCPIGTGCRPVSTGCGSGVPGVVGAGCRCPSACARRASRGRG